MAVRGAIGGAWRRPGPASMLSVCRSTGSPKENLMRKMVAFVALTAAVVAGACDGLGQAMTAHTDIVARAGGLELTVDEAAALLQLNPRLPAQPEVVEALANLWTD